MALCLLDVSTGLCIFHSSHSIRCNGREDEISCIPDVYSVYVCLYISNVWKLGLGEFLPWRGDRKSTRLNSSHGYISYAVLFFNDTATTEIYTLSLHDALPIS